MRGTKSYFLCGIGGSGMLPLALILSARGCAVSGSDRAADQGLTPEKFAFLKSRGIRLFPQDGSGIVDPGMIVVTSAAVERTVPDVAAAIRVGAMMLTRAELLSKLFNAAEIGIGVAGTSGKSTTTGMVGWILQKAGLAPTVMNGAVMKNFVVRDVPFASALVGDEKVFVSEIDESDGSIARYFPAVAVLGNVAHDHKSMEELRALFAGFLVRAKKSVVNRDNAEAADLADHLPAGRVIGFSLCDPAADLFADAVAPAPDGIAFTLHARGEGAIPVRLKVPGRHNVSNALAAIGAALACGIPAAESVRYLEAFVGIRRRLETVGSRAGVTVIDDFAHNPDKIAATLAALHDFPGRLLIVFQPQGYGPLRLLKDEFVATFAEHLAADDVLTLCDPAYFGGTVDRSVGSLDIVRGVGEGGRTALYFPKREDCAAKLFEVVKPGDRLVVMGARDDTLSDFAAALLNKLG